MLVLCFLLLAIARFGSSDSSADELRREREASKSEAATFPLRLTSRQTWLSQAQPEWHLLLENRNR